MGHEHHFLSRLDRVSHSHVELALGLYRDHALLRFLLADVGLPEGAERVAISLEDPREGPFLVVTRDGHFVTCLGKGMRAPGLPVVTRSQLDGRMARVSTSRAQREQQKKLLGPDGEANALLKRIGAAGNELSAEEFSLISALQPLLAGQFLQMQGESTRELLTVQERLLPLLKRTDKPRAVYHPVLRGYWDMFWSIGHLSVLAAMGGPELFEQLENPRELSDRAFTMVSGNTVQFGVMATAVQGIWSAAKLGKTVLPAYKRLYDNAETYQGLIEAMYALVALGLRHSKLQAEVRKALASPPSFPHAPQMTKFAGVLAKMTQVPFDQPERCMRLQREHGTRVLRTLALYEPASSPLHFKRDEEVPEDLAMRVAIHDSGEFIRDQNTLVFMLYCLPWLARAPAEQLYLPRGLIRARHVPWRPELTLDLLRIWVDIDRRASAAKNKAEGPARKGPCPCGSGKKYKHCCEKEPA